MRVFWRMSHHPSVRRVTAIQGMSTTCALVAPLRDRMSCRRETWFWHRTNDYMMCSNTRVYVCALIDREWHGPPLVYTLRPTWITVGQLDISRATEKSGDSLFGVLGSFWRTVYPSGCYFHSFVRGVLLKAAEQITRQAGAHGPGPALHC